MPPPWYHGHWEHHWYGPWYAPPVAWFGAGVAVGASAAIPWDWGYSSYQNPYTVAPIVVENTTIDYSQPIATVPQPKGQTDDASVADNVERRLDAAREAYARGDYSAAGRDLDKAIAERPNDPILHEFRSLVGFAAGRYHDAAAGAYAVLSAGPGWDWTTLSGFYPNVDVYARQLHALEDYVKSHPDEADARFLLAYHYLTCGHVDAAASQLKQVARLNPKDRLSAELLASFANPQGEAPAPAHVAAPGAKVTADKLVGSWTAQQPDGTSIALTVADDSKYTWEVTRQGKTRAFQGSYALADDMLILKQGDVPAMVGQVAMTPDDRLSFKLANGNPGDPGLTFAK